MRNEVRDYVWWGGGARANLIAISGNQASRSCSQKRKLETGNMYGAAVILKVSPHGTRRLLNMQRTIWFRLRL